MLIINVMVKENSFSVIILLTKGISEIIYTTGRGSYPPLPSYTLVISYMGKETDMENKLTS